MASNKLVAYFSATRTTMRAAERLARAAGADLWRIEPEVPYTTADLNWNDKASRTSRECTDDACRPAIAGRVEDMDRYDVVFVGFPIWWYVAPKIIHTFLESYDFSGKTLVPFATSGGSLMGDTDQVLHALVPDTVSWKPGKLVNGMSEEALAAWVDSLGL